MSTKTTFKRIALVAVAALGLGVLSVAPSSATVTGTTVAVTNGNTTTGTSDSTTAAIISVSGLIDNAADTITVGFILKSVSSTGNSATAAMARISPLDTTTSANSRVSSTPLAGYTGVTFNAVTDSKTAQADAYGVGATGASYTGARFTVQMDSVTAAKAAGVYTYTAIVKSFSAGVTAPAVATADFTITLAASAAVTAAADTVVDPSKTTSFICAGDVSTCTADAAVSAVATNDLTVDATIILNLLNAGSYTTGVVDSVTATVTGAGLISFDGITYGKSVKIASSGSQRIRVLADGTAGVGTIAVSTLSGYSISKSVTFYAKAAKTITASVNNPVLVVGTNSKAVKAVAVDANGTNWAGQLYIYAVAAADALIGGSATTPVACAYDSTKVAHYCPISTIAAGTANFMVIDAATVALMTSTSASVAVKVSSATPATVKIAFDKASYQPFEKATIIVTPLDSTGATLGGQQFTALLASGGITSTQAFGSQSDTLTAASLTTSADSSSTAPRTAGAYTYTVYMPAQGTVTISATGGTSLALAGQVAVSASATISNSTVSASIDAATDAANEATDAANAATDATLAAADAADAATAAAMDASDAVAALSATVATLIASLKAQLTSLTNLVIKIQKKVKA
jgi:hypothetical protein